MTFGRLGLFRVSRTLEGGYINPHLMIDVF